VRSNEAFQNDLKLQGGTIVGSGPLVVSTAADSWRREPSVGDNLASIGI